MVDSNSCPFVFRCSVSGPEVSVGCRMVTEGFLWGENGPFSL